MGLREEVSTERAHLRIKILAIEDIARSWRFILRLIQYDLCGTSYYRD